MIGLQADTFANLQILNQKTEKIYEKSNSA